MLQKKVTSILYYRMDTKRNCKKCNNSIPNRVVIDGVQRNLKNRKFCLSCSPFGKHNTKDITKISKKKVSSGDRVSEYRRRLKCKLIDYKGGKCVDCGYDKDVPRAYDFHHRNPSEKLFGISSSLCKSFEELKKEVDKCDLLCCRCHAERHHFEDT